VKPEIFSVIDSEIIEENYKKLVLSSNKSSYVIKEDIVNKKGVLIAKHSATLQQSSWQKILQHKLQKPIDEYLEFSDQIDAMSLLDDMDKLFSSMLVDVSYNFDDTMKTIKKIIHLVKFDTVMLNKLTIYKSNKPNEFDHSLISAFLAVEIGLSFRFSDQDLIDLYCTCLLRDIGQLFIEPTLFSKAELSQQEYKAIMVHPVISHLILKGSKTRFSDQVLQGVLNHHERIDGSGYPRQLYGKSVGQFERIIAVVDTFEAMKRKQRSVEDSIWILKCLSDQKTIDGKNCRPVYDTNIVASLENLVNKDNATDLSEQQLHSLAKHVKNLLGSINIINDEIVTALKTVELKDTHTELHTLQHLVLSGSGLTDISFDMIPAKANDLNATRRDIERITPYLVTQLNRIAQSAKESKSKSKTKLIELTSSIYNKAHLLSRSVQQPLT